MAKNLKLVGISTFCSPLTSGQPVAKGEVCIFSEAVAEHCLKGAEKNEIGDAVPHWKETEEAPHWDFSEIAMPQAAHSAAARRLRHNIEEAGDPGSVSESAENANLVTPRTPTAQRKARSA